MKLPVFALTAVGILLDTCLRVVPALLPNLGAHLHTLLHLFRSSMPAGGAVLACQQRSGSSSAVCIAVTVAAELSCWQGQLSDSVRLQCAVFRSCCVDMSPV